MHAIRDLAVLLLFEDQPSSGGGITVFLPMAAMMVMFYLLMLRPQQKRMRKQQLERAQFLRSLRLGDRVVIEAGIIGTIVALRGATVHLQVAPTVSIVIMRSSVAGRPPADVEELHEIEG